MGGHFCFITSMGCGRSMARYTTLDWPNMMYSLRNPYALRFICRTFANSKRCVAPTHKTTRLAGAQPCSMVGARRLCEQYAPLLG